MLPKVLLTLIDNYNEDGTVWMDSTNSFWWFNGKRFELWTKAKTKTYYYCWFKKQLYLEIENNLVICFEQQKKLVPKEKLCFQLCLFMQKTTNITFKDNFAYYLIYDHYIKIMEYKKSTNRELPTKIHNMYGTKILASNSMIYVFTQNITGHSEKYDLKTNKWVNITKCPIECYNDNDLIIVQNEVFLIDNCKSYWVYDDLKDTWIHKSKLKKK